MTLDQAFEGACSRFTASNFESLSTDERLLVTIWGLEADVNNGGFDQYYFNSSGDQAWFAPSALRAIGADRMAAIVERANALFGRDGPPSVRDERQEALANITGSDEDAWEALDREFFSYPDDIAGLLTAFLGLDGLE